MKNSLVAAFAAIAAAFSATAATKAQISFEPGAWSTNDWILVKGPRWSYMHGFVQKEDCIENECPPISGVEIHKKHSSGVYSAMVFKDKAEIGQTVSSVMGFDWRMAPLIVIAEKLGKTETGELVFGEHWEIVLYDEGLNVWHHSIKDGKPFWYKAAYLKVPFNKDTRYNLEVKVTKTRKGVKEMMVRCCGYEIGYVDNDLPYLAEDPRTLKVHSVRNPAHGKLARTLYRVLSEERATSLVEVKLKSGRKNQIRVHFAESGHPVVGDARYGKGGGSLLLHSSRLAFVHPHSGERMVFETERPTWSV